jgi:hypothetical protein
MESYEGKGRARRAWDAYERGVRRASSPVVHPVAVYVSGRLAAAQIEELVGFWILWQLQGGFDGLRRMGMARSTIYKRISGFRAAFGEHPDVFELPGVTIDVSEYWAGAAKAEARRKRLVAKME